ncbi:Endothelial cell-specific molecule 1 [Branchiostoma belcheri]|nr:Endothelial cell-specific molecule 1 [Branchiostoma belcheri]
MTWLYQARDDNPNTTTVEEGAVQNSSITFQLITESTNGEYTCGVKAVNGEIFNSTFVLNATECPPNHFGEVCRQVCDCQYGGTCDRWEGCLCPPGRHGDRCEIVPKPNGSDEIDTVQTTQETQMKTWRWNHFHHGNREREHSFRTYDRGGRVWPCCTGRLRVPEGYEVLVAAKCIRPDRMTALAVRDFRREMDILARIHEDKDGHPNVVKFYGVVTKSDPQYIVVEYAANEELRRYLWSLREERKITGSLKLLERLGFASDVASGLSEMARLKIVHRDIAARNVVITGKKEAKIADFGLARDVYVSSAYARTQQGVDAVESLRDGVYTCESDVWSYGVLLWEIASFGEEPRYAGGPMHPDVCTLLELLRKGVRLQNSRRTARWRCTASSGPVG